jgi:hypothetical protein
MADEIVRLCSKVTLTEGEQEGIQVTEGEIAEGRELGERCLVGNIWAGKHVNREAFTSMLSRVWRLVGNVVFKDLHDNLWLFEFEKEDDKSRVLAGRPWSFDRQIVVLNEFDGQCPPAQMTFTHSPIWIQVHDMPLLCMTKGIGMKIGASLGDLEDVDVAGEGVGWGRCLCLRVSIDLSKPLERGRALVIGGKSQWVSFKYEKLPLFCFSCGRVVHQQGCPNAVSLRMGMVEKEKQCGVWLRADTARSSMSSSQWSGDGPSHQDRRDTDVSLRETFQSHFHCSENHGKSVPTATADGARGNGDRVSHRRGAENRGSYHGDKTTGHVVDESEDQANAEKLAVAPQKPRFQRCDEVDDHVGALSRDAYRGGQPAEEPRRWNV